ncbi:hypothetical protein C7B67_06315 [filamentous cyanobacterium Phorm 6]|nr:hypothetical protein C7B67_06315 [filamentous cyanobacterium Phorm 6]
MDFNINLTKVQSASKISREGGDFGGRWAPGKLPSNAGHKDMAVLYDLNCIRCGGWLMARSPKSISCSKNQVSHQFPEPRRMREKSLKNRQPKTQILSRFCSL